MKDKARARMMQARMVSRYDEGQLDWMVKLS
jgi:hypothetical protein